MIATVKAERPDAYGHNIQMACQAHETDEEIITRCKSFLKSDYEKKTTPNFIGFKVTERLK